jgi:hypothetical protein
MTTPPPSETVVRVESVGVTTGRSCRIVIRGRLSDRLGAAFPEMSLERRPGRTVMRGAVDGARLDDLLGRLRDLGLEPLSVDVDE